MPFKPKKPCKHPGCSLLTAAMCCEFHAKLHTHDRASAHERGYTARWRKASKAFLKNRPVCCNCQSEGKLTQATVVDHIKPHRGDMILFWDESNWQPLCKSCHDAKTRTTDQYQVYGY